MNVRIALLTAFGLGTLRPGPGTWGSLPAIGVALLSAWLFDAGSLTDGDPHGAIHANITVGLFGLAFGIACVRFGAFGEKRLGGKDAQSIVADEVAGQSIALLALPWRSFGDEGAAGWNWAIAAAAFVMFRLFDIVKPPPARSLQNIPGGWGILIDDVIAGVYALIATQVVTRALLPTLL